MLRDFGAVVVGATMVVLLSLLLLLLWLFSLFGFMAPNRARGLTGATAALPVDTAAVIMGDHGGKVVVSRWLLLLLL